jgi:ABC-type phosphate/phosphonate transport system permease subunit
MNQFVDAIDFIFTERESPAGGARVGGLAKMWELTWEHLQLSGASIAIACAIAIPLGLWLGHTGRGGFLAINASNVGRAVPSLALIAFFVAYIGVGFTNLTLALVLLAVPPILTNAYTGVRQVDRDTVDSARGMGMTGAHGDDRAAGRGGHARRPNHQREHVRRRRQTGRRAGGGTARRRHGTGPRSGAARRDPARTEA